MIDQNTDNSNQNSLGWWTHCIVHNKIVKKNKHTVTFNRVFNGTLPGWPSALIKFEWLHYLCEKTTLSQEYITAKCNIALSTLENSTRNVLLFFFFQVYFLFSKLEVLHTFWLLRLYFFLQRQTFTKWQWLKLKAK